MRFLFKKLLLFFLVFGAMQLTAQRSNFWLKGIVRDSTELIANAHIVNISTEKGTFSGDYGMYRLVVSIGDTIQVSSVQYESRTKVITEQIAFSKKLNFLLVRKVVELDEIVLKEHDLTGILGTDRKKVPKDSIAAVGRSISNAIEELAENESQGAPRNSDSATKETSAVVTRTTDPTNKFDGVGGAIGLGSGNKQKKKIKKITSDTFTNSIILKRYGKAFFLELDIPENHIFNFISHCKKFNIKELYNKGFFLQIAVILERESTVYLKTLK